MDPEEKKANQDKNETESAAGTACTADRAQDGEKLVEELEAILEKQIQASHTGNIARVEVLSIQAEAFVQQISRLRLLEQHRFSKRRWSLQRLYEDLCLALSGEKDSVGRQLNRVRKGRKTVAAYRSNM